jgi:hypothetical protein
MHINLQLLPFDAQPSSFIADSLHGCKTWGYQRKNTYDNADGGALEVTITRLKATKMRMQQI